MLPQQWWGGPCLGPALAVWRQETKQTEPDQPRTQPQHPNRKSNSARPQHPNRKSTLQGHKIQLREKYQIRCKTYATLWLPNKTNISVNSMQQRHPVLQFLCQNHPRQSLHPKMFSLNKKEPENECSDIIIKACAQRIDRRRKAWKHLHADKKTLQLIHIELLLKKY